MGIYSYGDDDKRIGNDDDDSDDSNDDGDDSDDSNDGGGVAAHCIGSIHDNNGILSFQAVPLDINYDTFYEKRKLLIDQHLDKIRFSSCEVCCLIFMQLQSWTK